MGDARHILGSAAEAAAASWLERLGWRVIGRRVRVPGRGEIDVLALDPDAVLVAVEVRARRTARAGAAVETVDTVRVARLRRALSAVAGAQQHRGLRVDLVTAEPAGDGSRRWRLTRIPGVG